MDDIAGRPRSQTGDTWNSDPSPCQCGRGQGAEGAEGDSPAQLPSSPYPGRPYRCRPRGPHGSGRVGARRPRWKKVGLAWRPPMTGGGGGVDTAAMVRVQMVGRTSLVKGWWPRTCPASQKPGKKKV